MRLALLGGGGFRVPLVFGALLRDTSPRRVTEVVLYDVDPVRLDVMAHVLSQLSERVRRSSPDLPPPPSVLVTTSLAEATTGVDVVFSAMRVGGLLGRTCDERVALDLGVLGQETTGAGGIAYGLRTIPVALEVARELRERSPAALCITFTNPAGMITEAMSSILPGRVVGICDSPIGLAVRAARAVGVPHLVLGGGAAGDVELDYIGLNHLGWLRSLRRGGQELLPGLLADDAALAGFEEGRLFGAPWLRELGALPNEYLFYYYFTRDAIASISAAPASRGEFLARQQEAFYAAAAAAPERALTGWDAARAEREATYLAEARAQGEKRDALDLQGGGYEGVALALMAAVLRDEPATMILNVPLDADTAARVVPGLSPGAVVETVCRVDANGPRPVLAPGSRPLSGHMLGLVQQVKEVERATIEAAVTGSPDAAVRAFAVHPLVDSVTTARDLLAGYRAAIPQVDAVFTR